MSLDENIALGALPLDKSAIFLCDLQEKFRPAMLHFAAVVSNAKKLVESTRILGVPLIVTEQYPKGLGNTVSEIDIQHALAIVPKTKFSMVVPEVEPLLKEVCGGNLKVAILFGVEAHVCVEQTAMDLMSKGIKVHIVADATTSRTQEDRLLALERLKQIGCFVTSSENVIYKILGDKDHPKFNEIRPLIKDTTLETGLVSKMGDAGLAKLTWRYKIELTHTVLTKLVVDGRINEPIDQLVKELMFIKSCDNPVKDSANKPISTRWRNDKESQKKITPEAKKKEKNCQVCGKVFTRLQDLERHERSHYETSTFLCDLCGKGYRSLDGLNYHKTVAHPRISPTTPATLHCLDCDKTFTCSSRLKVHVKNSHNRAQRLLTCPYCDKSFKRTDVYKSHVSLHGPAPRPLTCLHCPKTFSTRSNLRAHSRVHDASSALQCTHCLKKFNSRIRLDSHIPECLSRKNCTSCKFSCKNNEELMEHMKNVHPADYALHAVFGETLEGLVN